MALTTNLRIKPYTDASDVRKTAEDMVAMLEKELNKHSKDKDFMGLNSRVKNTIQSAKGQLKELDRLGTLEFKWKGEDQLTKAEDKLVDLRVELKNAQKDLEEFAEGSGKIAIAEAIDKEFADVEKSAKKALFEAESHVRQLEIKKRDYEKGWDDSEVLAESARQSKKIYEKQYEDAKKYYAKHKALMDSGQDKSKRGAEVRQQLIGLPTNIKQANDQIKISNRQAEYFMNRVAATEKELEKATKAVEPFKKALDDIQAKKSERIANISQGQLAQLPEYQEKQANVTAISAKEQQQAALVTQLRQKEAQAEEEFAQSVIESQAKVENALDKTNDTMKVEAVQYQEAGSKLGQAFQKVLPILNTVKSGVGSVLSIVPSAVGRITNALHKLTTIIHLPKISSGIKDILRGMKRMVAMFGGVALGARGLFSIFNKLRSAVLTGFKDIYNQDKQFKTQIDTIKQKVLDIQVAFAEALMPVIQMALPYIKQLLDWVMSLLGVLTRFISTITGIKAYGKAIKGLGGAAQQANKQLSKFDELNNLTSGGGNGLTPDASSIGDPKKIDDWFTFVRNIVDKVEEMLRAIPWDDIYAKAEKFGQIVGQILLAIFKPSLWNAIGETIAGVVNTLFHFFNALGHTPELFENVGKSIFQAITGLLDKLDFALIMDTLITWADGFWTIIKTVLTERGESGETLAERIVRMITTSLSMINWQEVYNKVKEIANTLGETLNQLIDPDLAGQIGRTLGGTLMSIINFALEFLSTVDWEELGESISNGINEFFKEFDGSTLASAINAFFNAIITTVKTIIHEVDWGAVWEDVKAILKEVDWGAVLSVIVPLIAPTLFKILFDVIKIVWNLIKVPLLNFLKTTVWPEIQAFFTEIFGNLSGFFTTVGSWISTALALLLEFLGVWQLVAGLGESLSLLFGGKFMGASSENWAESSPIAMLIKMITGGFDSSAWDEVWFEFFDNIVQFWTVDVPQFFDEHPFASIIFGTGSGTSIKEGATKVLSKITEAWTEFSDTLIAAITLWFDDNIRPFFDIATWQTLVQPIFNSISKIWTDTQTWWNTNIVAWWNTSVAPWFTLAKWTGIVTNIKNSIVNIWNQTKAWWQTNITSWWNTNVAPWFTLAKWTSMLNTIPTAFTSAFKAAANAAISMLNKVISAVEDFVNNGVISGVNGLINTANLLPGVDIPTFSGSISLPKIPALAQGTVIPPSMSEFIAKLGDNNAETEIVSPLSTMKQALQEALAEVNFGGDMTINLTVDGRVLAQTIVKQNEIYKKSSGRTLFS